MPRNLHPAIESLIRARIRQSLEAAIPKYAVLGGVGVAFGNDAEAIESALQWIMDSGLYAFQLATIAPPLLVYTGASMQAYIASAGTQHPDGSGNQYLIGEAQSVNPGCFDWPTTPPTLDANLAYESFTENTPPKLTQPGNDPVEYTGLMRLAVQSKIGSGRSADELVPSWTMDGDKIGIVRSIDFIYYSIQTDANGCLAQRLENHPSMECVRTWLTDYKAGALVLADDDAMRLEAWLISSLTVDSTYAQTLLITVAALAPVLGDSRSPLSHGWHYSYDYISGTWHNACSIVTWRVGPGATTSNYYWESSQAIITFTVSTLSISAAIATPHLDRQIGVYWPVDKLWYAITAAQSEMLLPPSSGTTIAEVGVDVPFYCFYTPGGLQLATISYAEVLPADATQTAQANCLDCGQAFLEDAVEWSFVSYRGGGFKVGPVTSGIIASTYIGFDERDLGIYGGPGSLSGVEFNTFVSNLLGNPSCGYSYQLSDFLIDEVCLEDTGSEVVQVTMEWYSQAIFNWYRGNRSGLPRRCVVISGYDPDAVYFVEANEQTENWSNYEANYAQNVLFGYQADLSGGGNTGMKRFQTRSHMSLLPEGHSWNRCRICKGCLWCIIIRIR